MLAVGLPFMAYGPATLLLSPGAAWRAQDIAGTVVIALVGLGFWQYLESSRVILENGVLSRRIFGISLWRIEAEKAHIRSGRDPQKQYSWSVLRVSDRTRRRRNFVGVIPYRQFYPADIVRLLEALGQPVVL